MVGVATRASNDNIKRRGTGGQGDINSLALQYREIFRWRETEFTQVLQERLRTTGGPTVFLKTNTEVDKTKGAGSCFSIAWHYFAFAVNWRCGLSVRLGVGGGRKQKGLGQRHFFKIRKARMRSARRHLRSSKKRFSWSSLSSNGTWRGPLTSRVARRWILFSLLISPFSVGAFASRYGCTLAQTMKSNRPAVLAVITGSVRALSLR